MASSESAMKVKEHKRNGRHESFWMSDELAEKMDALVESSGMTRTKVWKALLENRPLPEKTYKRMCGEIAKIGGFMKSQVKSGKHGDAYKLGQELVDIARELKGSQEMENGDHGNSEKN